MNIHYFMKILLVSGEVYQYLYYDNIPTSSAWQTSINLILMSILFLNPNKISILPFNFIFESLNV